MTDATPVKKRRPVRQLTEAQKAEAIALWKAGAVSLADLEKKFKKDRTTFLRVFKEAGVTKGETAEENAKKVQEAVEQTLINDATVLAERIKNTKDETYKIASAIRRAVGMLIVKAQRENVPFATLANDMKALQLGANTIKIVREECYAVLGVSVDDANEDKPLPDLEIRELTIEDIKKMHAAQVVQDDFGLDELDKLGDEAILTEDDRVETEE